MTILEKNVADFDRESASTDSNNIPKWRGIWKEIPRKAGKGGLYLRRASGSPNRIDDSPKESEKYDAGCECDEKGKSKIGVVRAAIS
jgi:hypothetical protein